MKIRLLFVGKNETGGMEEAFLQYCEKITRYFPFEWEAVPYLKITRALPIAEQKQRECENLLKKIMSAEHVVLLDEAGKEQTSPEFAGFVQQQLNRGLKSLVFVIGGAYGFSPEMYQRAQSSLSLSRMTLPHVMARLFFAEQLYRACTILRNEPYHHG
jgi:23S rRNA (pseudouridine1915-N3)-methyltransferase